MWIIVEGSRLKIGNTISVLGNGDYLPIIAEHFTEFFTNQSGRRPTEYKLTILLTKSSQIGIIGGCDFL